MGVTTPYNTSPSLSNQSADDLMFNPGQSGMDSGPLQAESQFVPGPYNQPLGPDPNKFTPTMGQSNNSSPSKPSDVTGDTGDDQEGTMYDARGNVIPPEQTIPRGGSAAAGGVAGTWAGGAALGAFPELRAIPGADKGVPAAGAAIGAGIGYSTPFNHAINRGVNTFLYPGGGFSPGTSKEDDITPFLRD